MVEIAQTDIKVYTRPNCVPCKATKRLLTKLGHEYEEIAITEEIGAELRELGYTTAPVVDVVSYYFDADEPYAVNAMTWCGYKPDLIHSVLSD